MLPQPTHISFHSLTTSFTLLEVDQVPYPVSRRLAFPSHWAAWCTAALWDFSHHQHPCRAPQTTRRHCDSLSLGRGLRTGAANKFPGGGGDAGPVATLGEPLTFRNQFLKTRHTCECLWCSFLMSWFPQLKTGIIPPTTSLYLIRKYQVDTASHVETCS